MKKVEFTLAEVDFLNTILGKISINCTAPEAPIVLIHVQSIAQKLNAPSQPAENLKQDKPAASKE